LISKSLTSDSALVSPDLGARLRAYPDVLSSAMIARMDGNAQGWTSHSVVENTEGIVAVDLRGQDCPHDNCGAPVLLVQRLTWRRQQSELNKKRTRFLRALLCSSNRLEVDLRSDLQVSWIVPGRDGSEVRISHVGIDRARIAVVEGVEGFQT
jgi:hypothetical protein